MSASSSRLLLRTTSSSSSSASSSHALTFATGRRSRSFFARAAKPAAAVAQPTSTSTSPTQTTTSKPLTTLQEANPRNLPEVWFNPTFPYKNGTTPPLGQGSDRPPDERKAKLGKTLRILQERLPTLLQSPLPQEILAPNISLHLFPSTHPHLPTVSGRVAYIAALWTSPLAWNRLPLIGDVRLEILSERMVNKDYLHPAGAQLTGQLGPSQGQGQGQGGGGGGRGGAEQLIVRWRTTGGRPIRWRLPFRDLFQASDEQTDKAFTGLFIFEFDGEGRILNHTIEHVQSGGEWQKGVGAKVVGLTDWLLGGMKGGNNEGCPAFEFHRDEPTKRRR